MKKKQLTFLDHPLLSVRRRKWKSYWRNDMLFSNDEYNSRKEKNEEDGSENKE